MSEKHRTKKQLATVTDYKALFNSAAGRRVLWDLMKYTNMLSPCTIAGDSHMTHFNDGMRSVCLYILQKINTNSKQLEEIISGGQNEDQAWNLFASERSN